VGLRARAADELPVSGAAVGPVRTLGRGLWAKASAYLPEGWGATALVAAAVTVLNWPAWTPIRTGLDPSWQAGLAVAFTRHFQWGPQLDFTYGPYGFAGFIEPFYRSTALIAILYVFAVTSLLAALLVAGLRRYWGLASAGVIAWAVTALSWAVTRAADFASVAGLGLALGVLQAQSRAVRAMLVSVLGAVAGFVLLVKLNTGVTLTGLLVLALAGAAGPWRQRLRLAVPALGALVAVFAASWAAAGQSFTHLAEFAHASMSLALGYSAAISGHVDQASIAWYALVISLLLVLVFASALRHRPLRQQVATSLMLIGWGWAITKDSFVSGNHFPGFFRVVLAAVALLCTFRPPQRVYAWALALAACITMATAQFPPVSPIASVHALGTELADLVQPGRFARLAAGARDRLLRDELLSGATLARLGGHSLAIEPWEDMVAWADPQARWDPEPVVQAYSAYTTYLDDLDAAFLASSRAPQLLLYWPLQFAFDLRDPFMDPPTTTVAIYCHYDQIAVQAPWQILRRVPDKCGRAVVIGRALARFGQAVTVPGAPGKMLVASFSLDLPLLSRVEGVLLKPPDVYLKVWSGRRRPLTYRFVDGTQADEHVLSVPVTFGYSPPFAPATVDRLEILGGGWASGQGSVAITFRALSMAPPAGPPASPARAQA
jgi:hypothetical protein